MTTFRSTFTTIAVAAIAYLHLPTALANETANARTTQQRHSPLHPKADEFALVFQDEFNGSALDWNVWDSEDGVKRSPSGQRTRRSPANVTVEDGLLKLNVRKELVNGADWTAAYVWLRENFGPNTYYEARFANTKATGINNAFWFATRTAERKIYRDRYEIDCPENKLHEDGTVHAHLAWHDWKSYRRSDGQHVAQGMRVILEDTGFQTWGVWIGENEFAIYCEGELVWDGTTHAKYHDQWQTGMGKLARWTNDEEQRAYGKHGQDDWSYFGGMNGDVLNLCLATIPWQSKGSPLTDDADGTFMGVDYIRVYKPKVQLSWKPTQKLQTIPPGKPIGLKSPVVLSEAGTEYFSFLVRAGADLPVKCMCKSGERTVCTLAVEPDGSLKLTSNHGNASTAVSYPARTLNRQAWQTGTEHLVVCRITANESGRDIISVATFPTSDPLPVLEPYLYPNIDEHGNTSITNQWDLSVKSTVDGTIDAIRFDFDPDAAACRCFQAGRGFTSVAAGNRRHAHRHIGKPIDLVDVPADLVLPTLTDDEPAAGKRVRMQLPGWAQSEVYHSLYLPYNWTPDRTYPVIVEFPGNGPFHNRFGDICDGIVDNAALGYGLTEGTDFIWIVVAPISEDRSRNQRYWWGDIDATVDYCIDAVRHTCREYGGDPDRVVLTGFSRGAIGIGYVGLHNAEIAGLWRAFIHYSGYDGVREWNYPKSSRTDALERFERHGDRPALVIDDGSTAAKERYIQSTGTEAPFTFLSTGFRNHNDKWVLRDVPARAAARAWLAGVTRLGATQSVGGSAAPKGEVVHVAEHGAMPNDGHCDRDAIQAAVDQAIALQQRSDAAVAIEFAAGVYNLREPKLERDGKQRFASHIIIKDATNLTLRGAAKANGEPATVLERNVPKLLSRMALARLVHVDGGTNVALQNVVLDNNPRFASAGVCVLVDEANDAVEVDVFDGVPHFDGMDAFSANVWDLKTRDLRPGVPHLSIGTSYRGFPVQWRHVPGGKGRRYRIERMGFAAHLNVGDGVSWHFNVETPAHNMLRAKSTDTLTMENVHITNGPAAVVSMHDVGDLTCRRVMLVPVGNQLAVGPRDGMYTAGSHGEYLYENCVFSGLRWDPLPLFDKVAFIDEMIDARTANMFWYRSSTYDIEGVDALLWIDGAAPVNTKIVSHKWGKTDREKGGRKGVIRRGTVKFADDVPQGFGAGSIFTPIRRSSTVIRNCTFENNYGRSPYLSGVNMLIEGNTFRNNGYAFALGISSAGAGGFVHDVTIRDNTFENCAWSSVSPGIPTSGAVRFYEQQRYRFSDEAYHSGVLIENNTFKNVGLSPHYAAIDLRNARDFIIRGNTYIDTKKRTQVDPMSTDASSIRIEDE